MVSQFRAQFREEKEQEKAEIQGCCTFAVTIIGLAEMNFLELSSFTVTAASPSTSISTSPATSARRLSSSSYEPATVNV